MDKLDALASVVRLNDRVVRILGQNPGKFTLQGTNTYLVGGNAPYTLIDTGEGRPSYIPHLESALEHGTKTDPPRQHISDILLSHWHPDHTGGLFSVLTLLKTLWDAQHAPLPFQPPRLHKFPLRTPLSDDRFDRAVQPLVPGMYTPSPRGALFHDLHHGQSFAISPVDPSAPSDAAFRVVHAPGHTEDSLALFFSSEDALYTADTVLGRGTAVFEDLGTYMSTLRSLLSYLGTSTVLYPGHGPVVHDGQGVLKTYIEHRMQRETQIIHVLQQTPEDASTWHIVSEIYAAYPRDLWEPAAGSVNLHLQKLLTEGKVERLSGQGKDAQWRLHQTAL